MDLIAVGMAGMEALYTFIMLIPTFISVFFTVIFFVIEWLVFFIFNFWILFALIEILILGIAISRKTFMEKINDLFYLHKVVYIDVFYTIVLNLVKLAVRVINTIGNYIPFT